MVSGYSKAFVTQDHMTQKVDDSTILYKIISHKSRFEFSLLLNREKKRKNSSQSDKVISNLISITSDDVS